MLIRTLVFAVYTTDGLKNKHPDKYTVNTKTDYPADKNAYRFLLDKIDDTKVKSQFLQLMT